MKRVLMLASVASMIDQFNMGNITLLQEMGYAVDVACNFEYGNTCSAERIADLKERLKTLDVRFFQIDFTRNVLNLKQDLVAYRQVKKILEENTYAFLHCHSPIGGVVGRLAGKRAGVKVIYTAHGFHFYKGAPLLNWLIFYPIEKWLARYTDVLITMNGEDYNRALNKFHAKSVEFIHGVGIDTTFFCAVKIDPKEKCQQFGIPENARILLSVGELNANKNHRVVIEALKELNDSAYHYVIVGRGGGKEGLEQLAEQLGVADRLHLLGFRTDVAELYAMADVFVFPSKREGLPVALMESMASGLPVVASRIRGNSDLVVDGETGYLVPVENVKAYSEKIQMLTLDPQLRIGMGEAAKKRIDAYDCSKVLEEMRLIYQKMSEE